MVRLRVWESRASNHAQSLASPLDSTPQSGVTVFSPPRATIALSDNIDSSQTSPSAAGTSQGGSTAEQKRRSHIKNGFETLQSLVPALANNPTNKVSKAAMLTKTADFALKLKTERQQMQEEADLLQQEIDALNTAISTCQCQLPATGVPVTQQHSDQMKKMLHAYIKDRTNQNWKFYVFSQMATPLFDSFNGIVSTASIEELYRTTQLWLDQHCSLPALRPAVSNSLRTIGTETSILSDPQSFPEQARHAVNNLQSTSSQASNSSTQSGSDFHNINNGL